MFFKLKNNWGFSLFALTSLVGFMRLLRQDVPGHYRIFSGAAQALWSGHNPHGTDFGTGVGYWFYSPTCGMFFFGPLSLLPEKLGLTLYVLLSWIVFVYAVIVFKRELLRKIDGANAGACPCDHLPVGTLVNHHHHSHQIMNWFWAAMAPQILLGILASKLEVLMVGLLLISVTWILKNKRVGLAAAPLALIVNWKFQPLPTVGLLALTLVLSKNHWGFMLSKLLAWFIAWSLAPLAILPYKQVLFIYQDWNITLSLFVQSAWTNFDNLHAFLHHALGLTYSFHTAQILLAIVGLGLAALLVLSLLRLKKFYPTINPLTAGVCLSLSFGAMFTTALSPLNQNNGYILYAPLLLVTLFLFYLSSERWKIFWSIILLSSVMVLTFGYSDLIPAEPRATLRHAAIKSVACLTLGFAVAIYSLSRQWLALWKPTQSSKHCC